MTIPNGSKAASISAHHRARVYVVEPTDEHAPLRPHLVRTTHRSHALTCVSQNLFEVRLASQDDLEKYLGEGLRVERFAPRMEQESAQAATPLKEERQRQER